MRARIHEPLILICFLGSLGVFGCTDTEIEIPVQSPVLVKQVKWTGTAWFSSPIVHNLGDGDTKLIGTFYDIIVWDNQFNEIARAPHGGDYPHKGRIYSPAVCADLENDGIYEIIVGSTEGSVAAYEWRNSALKIKQGWPASACDAGQCPEVRGDCRRRSGQKRYHRDRRYHHADQWGCPGLCFQPRRNVVSAPWMLVSGMAPLQFIVRNRRRRRFKRPGKPWLWVFRVKCGDRQSR